MIVRTPDETVGCDVFLVSFYSPPTSLLAMCISSSMLCGIRTLDSRNREE